jgi:hypothetical protein
MIYLINYFLKKKKNKFKFKSKSKGVVIQMENMLH